MFLLTEIRRWGRLREKSAPMTNCPRGVYPYGQLESVNWLAIEFLDWYAQRNAGDHRAVRIFPPPDVAFAAPRPPAFLFSVDVR
jgi:hypothetical protein